MCRYTHRAGAQLLHVVILCQANTVPDELMLPACERGSWEYVSVLKHRQWELRSRAEITGEVLEYSSLITPGNRALLLGACQPLSASTLLPELPGTENDLHQRLHRRAASPHSPPAAGLERSRQGEQPPWRVTGLLASCQVEPWPRSCTCFPLQAGGRAWLLP